MEKFDGGAEMRIDVGHGRPKRKLERKAGRGSSGAEELKRSETERGRVGEEERHRASCHRQIAIVAAMGKSFTELNQP